MTQNDADILIRLIEHLQKVDNNFVSAIFTNRVMEETFYHQPQELSDIPALAEREIQQRRQWLKEAKTPAEARVQKIFIARLENCIELRKRIQAYLAATCKVLKAMPLSTEQKARLERSIKAWKGNHGVDIERLAERTSLENARRMLGSLRHETPRFKEPAINAEKLKGLKPLIRKIGLNPFQIRRK